MPYKDEETAKNYAREYYQKNKDRIKRNANKPERREKRTEWKRKNEEALTEYNKEYHAEWYQKNSDKVKLRVKTRWTEQMRLLTEVKKHYGCMNPNCCWKGELSPSILDFHHVDPKGKQANVLKMIGHSNAEIAKEVKKCVVLCANCHRLAHAQGVEFTLTCQVTDELII